MRFWHYKLIPVLPNKHLVSQWRECCAASRMKVIGKKHVLIDKAWNYDDDHFRIYTALVEQEMKNRGFKIGDRSYKTLEENIQYLSSKIIWNRKDSTILVNNSIPLFGNWHNNRYLLQCYYMFQEKYDVGMINDSEFEKIEKYTKEVGFPEILFKI